MQFRKFGRLLPLETARSRLLRAARPIQRTEPLPVALALGRIAAETVRASAPIPAFRRATWDGYALHSRDTRDASERKPVRLHVVGEVFAESRTTRLRPGEAAEIATGGALPNGADAVVMFERVKRQREFVEVPFRVSSGDRIADAGDDLPKGATAVAAGEVLTAAALGALATVGRRTVQVYDRPRVRLLASGNELVAVGSPLGPGQIHESNLAPLCGLVLAAGGVPSTEAPLPDDPVQIEAALRRGLDEADLIVTSGGSSVGERDYLPQLFPRLGRMLFHGVAVRPGKPTLAAAAGPKLLVGFPGHPASGLANGYWLLWPLLRKLAGFPDAGWIQVPARMAEAWTLPSSRMSTFVPLELQEGRATPTFRDSSSITSLRQANAFLLLPPGHRSLRRGEAIEATLLPRPLAEPPRSRPGRGPK